VQLARWGLLDEVLATEAPKIQTVTFHVGDEPPLVKTVKNRAGIDHLVAPRRYVLDHILLEAARRAGATVPTGVMVKDVARDASGRVNGVQLRDRDGRDQELGARFVVGADGVWSRIARAVGARAIDERPAVGAMHYTYAKGLGAIGSEFHASERGFTGIFPTNDEE